MVYMGDLEKRGELIRTQRKRKKKYVGKDFLSIVILYFQ